MCPKNYSTNQMLPQLAMMVTGFMAKQNGGIDQVPHGGPHFRSPLSGP